MRGPAARLSSARPSRRRSRRLRRRLRRASSPPARRHRDRSSSARASASASASRSRRRPRRRAPCTAPASGRCRRSTRVASPTARRSRFAPSRRRRASGSFHTSECRGGVERRQLEIGVHHADAVVWEPVYRTRLNVSVATRNAAIASSFVSIIRVNRRSLAAQSSFAFKSTLSCALNARSPRSRSSLNPATPSSLEPSSDRGLELHRGDVRHARPVRGVKLELATFQLAREALERLLSRDALELSTLVLDARGGARLDARSHSLPRRLGGREQRGGRVLVAKPRLLRVFPRAPRPRRVRVRLEVHDDARVVVRVVVSFAFAFVVVVARRSLRAFRLLATLPPSPARRARVHVEPPHLVLPLASRRGEVPQTRGVHAARVDSLLASRASLARLRAHLGRYARPRERVLGRVDPVLPRDDRAVVPHEIPAEPRHELAEGDVRDPARPHRAESGVATRDVADAPE
eukprot:30942-Pelagococcus_subviridis.AAC.7